jgi:hypothetical protein
MATRTNAGRFIKLPPEEGRGDGPQPFKTMKRAGFRLAQGGGVAGNG